MNNNYIIKQKCKINKIYYLIYRVKKNNNKPNSSYIAKVP